MRTIVDHLPQPSLPIPKRLRGVMSEHFQADGPDLCTHVSQCWQESWHQLTSTNKRILIVTKALSLGPTYMFAEDTVYVS